MAAAWSSPSERRQHNRRSSDRLEIITSLNVHFKQTAGNGHDFDLSLFIHIFIQPTVELRELFAEANSIYRLHGNL